MLHPCCNSALEACQRLQTTTLSAPKNRITPLLLLQPLVIRVLEENKIDRKKYISKDIVKFGYKMWVQ